MNVYYFRYWVNSVISSTYILMLHAFACNNYVSNWFKTNFIYLSIFVVSPAVSVSHFFRNPVSVSMLDSFHATT